MGARAVRIAREELVTPPEFARVPLGGNPNARIGGARIELIREGSRTRVGSLYQQIPTRVMPSFDFADEPAALLYTITLTTGLLDGDGHVMEVVARKGTSAVVTGQSATRIHPATTSFATQQWTATVEEGATLVVLPGPNIPYRGSRFYQRGRADIAPGGRLLWGDVWYPGRYERGELSERFVFDRLVQDFEARRGGRLVYRDRFAWKGPWSGEEIAWYFGDARATGSLFVGGPLPGALPEAHPGVRRAVMPLDTGEACVRWCGPTQEVTADVVRVTMAIAGAWTGGRPWLLGSTELSPNHWFSVPG